MAQLRDTVVDGNLEVTNDISLKTNSKSIKGIHPETGVESRMLHMSEYGNTIVGYDGYANENGNTHIYGNDVACYVAKVNDDFRPYYRSEDVLEFNKTETIIRTSGYVTNEGKDVVFTIPLSKPIIGSPSAEVYESEGFKLRQNNKYTHDSSASAYTKPTSYDIYINPHIGLVVTAHFDITTNVINNNPIGIYWSGIIKLTN